MDKAVVLLEDEPELAELVVTLLEEAGYTVIHTTGVDELLREAVQRSPCVALVDGMSPTEFDLWWLGPELSRLGVPAVAFTAHASAQIEFEANSHDFAGIVTKPFEADEFVDLVNAICWDDFRAKVG